MTYRELRRSTKATELDRGTWAEVTKVTFDVLVKGVGEYLTPEPVWFGEAFDTPPFFTYSAVFRSSPNFSDVRALGLPTAGVSAVASTRGNHLFQDQFFPDGSFEHQMIWNDPVIPHWSTSYSRFQKIASEQSGTAPWYTQYDNWWVQEPAHDQWSVSSDRAYTVPFGYQGSYSAKYTFGQDPSPILIPFFPFEQQPEPFYDGSPPEKGIWSHKFELQADDDYVFQAPAWNPRQGEFRYVVHSYSDQTYTLEVKAVPFIVSPQIPSGYVELTGSTQEFDMEAGVWSDAVMNWAVQFEEEPNYPFTGEGPSNGVDTYGYVRVELRVKDGSSGQSVYVDEVWGQPRLRPGSLPLVTVGVAEWVQDDYGMYVGAYLWFKVSVEDFVPPALPPPTLVGL